MTDDLDLCAMSPYAEKDRPPNLRETVQAVINVLNERRYGLSAEQTKTLARWLEKRLRTD